MEFQWDKRRHTIRKLTKEYSETAGRCSKCGGEGWLWCDELDNRAGHDPTALVIDDTRYPCPECCTAPESEE